MTNLDLLIAEFSRRALAHDFDSAKLARAFVRAAATIAKLQGVSEADFAAACIAHVRGAYRSKQQLS